MAPTPTPHQTFLAPLDKLTLRHPDLEGQAIWWEDGFWQAQDDDGAMIDGEEIAFYAEGLLVEGFSLIWQAFAATETPKEPEHVVLMFWQGTAPPPPGPPEGWVVMAQGTWQGGA